MAAPRPRFRETSLSARPQTHLLRKKSRSPPDAHDNHRRELQSAGGGDCRFDLAEQPSAVTAMRSEARVEFPVGDGRGSIEDLVEGVTEPRQLVRTELQNACVGAGTEQPHGGHDNRCRLRWLPEEGWQEQGQPDDKGEHPGYDQCPKAFATEPLTHSARSGLRNDVCCRHDQEDAEEHQEGAYDNQRDVERGDGEDRANHSPNNELAAHNNHRRSSGCNSLSGSAEAAVTARLAHEVRGMDGVPEAGRPPSPPAGGLSPSLTRYDAGVRHEASGDEFGLRSGLRPCLEAHIRTTGSMCLSMRRNAPLSAAHGEQCLSACTVADSGLEAVPEPCPVSGVRAQPDPHLPALGVAPGPRAPAGGEGWGQVAGGAAVAAPGAVAPSGRRDRRRRCGHCQAVLEKNQQTVGPYHLSCWQEASERRAPALAEVRRRVQSTNAVARYLVEQTQNQLPSLLVPAGGSLTVRSAYLGAAPDASQNTRPLLSDLDASDCAGGDRGAGANSKAACTSQPTASRSQAGVSLSSDANDNHRLEQQQSAANEGTARQKRPIAVPR